MRSSDPPLPFHVVDLDAELAFTPLEEPVSAPLDEDDARAAAIVDALLEAGLLELVTPRSRAGVESRLAHLLALGVADPAEIADALIACPGVAELYADDDTLDALIASEGG